MSPEIKPEDVNTLIKSAQEASQINTWLLSIIGGLGTVIGILMTVLWKTTTESIKEKFAVLFEKVDGIEERLDENGQTYGEDKEEIKVGMAETKAHLQGLELRVNTLENKQ